MGIVTSTVTTTGGTAVLPGEHRAMNMLLVEGVPDAASTVFEVRMGSPMLLEAFGMAGSDYVDIISVTYDSAAVVDTHCGISEYSMATLAVRESNAMGQYLSQSNFRTVLTMPGHYRLVLRPPTTPGTFSVRITRLDHDTAELFTPPPKQATPPEMRTAAADGSLAITVPPGCTAQVASVLPGDTLLSSMVQFGGTYVDAMDTDGCCLCASNPYLVPMLSTLTLPSGVYNLTTLPPRPALPVSVAFTCS